MYIAKKKENVIFINKTKNPKEITRMKVKIDTYVWHWNVS